jgi:hypothetical protein
LVHSGESLFDGAVAVSEVTHLKVLPPQIEHDQVPAREKQLDHEEAAKRHFTIRRQHQQLERVRERGEEREERERERETDRERVRKT